MARRRSIEALAKSYLRAHAAAKLVEKLKPDLLTRMTAAGRSAIDVPGAGAVVLVPATSRELADVPALEARVAQLAARLRALGQEADDVVPRKASPVSACLKVSPPPAPPAPPAPASGAR